MRALRSAPPLSMYKLPQGPQDSDTAALRLHCPAAASLVPVPTTLSLWLWMFGGGLRTIPSVFTKSPDAVVGNAGVSVIDCAVVLGVCNTVVRDVVRGTPPHAEHAALVTSTVRRRGVVRHPRYVALATRLVRFPPLTIRREGGPRRQRVGRERGAEKRQVVEEDALEGLAVLRTHARGIARFFEDAVAA